MKLPGLRAANIPPSRLRQEIFSLGGRHQGDALAGARIELRADDLTAERRALLREVVSHLSPNERAPAGAAAAPAKPARFMDMLYLAVIFAAFSWIALALARF